MPIHTTINRISRMAITALTALTILAAPLPSNASEDAASVPHVADEKASSITVPVTQYWNVNDWPEDLTATYALTPEETSHQDGYTSNTVQAVADGLVTFRIGDQAPNNGTFILDGDEASVDIRYTWTSPGLYVFTLRGTNAPQENYTYDKQTYLIRVYVRSDGDSFITAENVAGDKVAAITFDPGYRLPHEDHDDSDDTPVTPSTPTSPVTPTTIQESGDNGTPSSPISIEESGNPDAGPTSISESGSGPGGYTGDESRIVLYGATIIAATTALAAWMAHQRGIRH